MPYLIVSGRLYRPDGVNAVGCTITGEAAGDYCDAVESRCVPGLCPPNTFNTKLLATDVLDRLEPLGWMVAAMCNIDRRTKDDQEWYTWTLYKSPPQVNVYMLDEMAEHHNSVATTNNHNASGDHNKRSITVPDRRSQEGDSHRLRDRRSSSIDEFSSRKTTGSSMTSANENKTRSDELHLMEAELNFRDNLKIQ